MEDENQQILSIISKQIKIGNYELAMEKIDRLPEAMILRGFE